MPLSNVLVVEDDPLWRGIYERNVDPGINGKLVIAQSLSEAQKAISEMAFAVAFVDIRLDEDDDQNIDGLKVLELLARMQEGTSSVMVTGKGTVGITRDALKKYDAFDALEKDKVDPADLAEFHARGTAIHNAVTPAARAADYLRGQRTMGDWESEMLAVTGGRGGVNMLIDFLERLAGAMVPLVPRQRGVGAHVDEGIGCAIGAFWSRSIGAPILIAYGTEQSVGEVVSSKQVGGFDIVGVLRERNMGHMYGAVFALTGLQRDDFA